MPVTDPNGDEGPRLAASAEVLQESTECKDSGSGNVLS